MLDINYGLAPTGMPQQQMGLTTGGGLGLQAPSSFGSVGSYGNPTSNMGGFGFNIPTAQLALGGFNSLGNIWGALQAQKLARDNFNFTRDVTNTNLTNSIQAYNTALTDKITSRAKTQGMSDTDRDAAIAANRMVRA